MTLNDLIEANAGMPEIKLLWLTPIEVNCRIGKGKAETPAVIRVLKQKRERNPQLIGRFFRSDYT